MTPIERLENHYLIEALKMHLQEAKARALRAEARAAALDQVWDMLAPAMSVIDDLTNLRPPAPRIQQAIDDLLEGIHELEGPQE